MIQKAYLKKVQRALCVLWLSTFLCGCAAGNSNQASALSRNEYAAILPYETGTVQIKHVGLLAGQNLRFAMEKGLMDFSKQYFSPDQYGYKTHVFLDFDELDATDGSRGLLGRVRDNNPNGLNPAPDAKFETGNGEVTGPVLILDLYELDFYQNNELKGISIGLVVPDTLEQDGKTYPIEPEEMDAFLEQSANKIVNYLRDRFPEISAALPVYIAAYQIDSQKPDNTGGFIFEAWYSNGRVSFNKIQEEYLYVPSEDFSLQEPEPAVHFSQFKSDILSVLRDATFVSGKARMLDGKMISLQIDIDLHAKTAGEVLAVIQQAKDKLSVFTDTDCSYRVVIENNQETMAVLQRRAGSVNVEATSLLT